MSTAFKNDRTGIVTCVPLTTANHSFPTHIPIPTGLSAEGFIETEQINSYDFYARHAVRKGELPSEFFPIHYGSY
ncbi:type II toxin-antitoxin system PemK/MazF family toxin [Lacticaseibacillus saniviri]|uniref:type II toxin-antitoxin system PemK/MazF family toxin n=1 Tax=Lacticaseibacillus saniviri TaxID=931533 RepID=UPI001CDB06FC